MKDVRRLAKLLKGVRDHEHDAEIDLREALDCSIRAGQAKNLCQKLGIGESLLSEVRKGTRGISSELLEKLCEVEG